MKLGFSEPQRIYQSGSQSARSLTEMWVAERMYCPNCGHARLNQFQANMPVADFYCANCQDQFELKSQKKSFGKKLVNGAYETKIRRLQSSNSPHLILMNYSIEQSAVRSLCVIPRRFFIHSIVERRKPLAETARRAGWVGSNILLERIPESGRIHVVRDGVTTSKDDVLALWTRTAFLNQWNAESRGWLVSIMNCIERLGADNFTLNHVYGFERHLSEIYPGNNNVRPKIRQQLQILRDNGYLEFLGNGTYRLIR